MSKTESAPNEDQLKDAVRREIRRLQKALATLSCLKLALAEEMSDEIDCEDAASVTCDLLAKAIGNLDATSSEQSRKRGRRSDDS